MAVVVVREIPHKANPIIEETAFRTRNVVLHNELICNKQRLSDKTYQEVCSSKTTEHDH